MDRTRENRKTSILATPGHSPDSVSLVLDEGIAFTGDLTQEGFISADDVAARASWKCIWDRNVKVVYPAHGPAIHARP